MFGLSRRARHAGATAVVLLACFASSANATPLYSSTASGAENNAGVTIGFQFTASIPLLVSDLGVFDGGTDGPLLQALRDVGLWDSGGALLASATVSNSSGIQAGFRYASITPVTLAAATQYTLGVFYASGLLGDKATGGVQTPAAGVTLGTTVTSSAVTSLTFPTLTNSTFVSTANLLFTPAPIPPDPGAKVAEPATLIVFGLGIVGLAAARRKRSSPPLDPPRGSTPPI